MRCWLERALREAMGTEQPWVSSSALESQYSVVLKDSTAKHAQLRYASNPHYSRCTRPSSFPDKSTVTAFIALIALACIPGTRLIVVVLVGLRIKLVPSVLLRFIHRKILDPRLPPLSHLS
ncbi:hypothetical protein FA15DRAFT_144700 [Coprinopsis marcescibilis]|uniref:Uncharacterized protein n=1 Tax=Coprinopsis marcescibilis TaxID=230819 RepID=A0A5C3KIK3_COPMA|nr:hypothetical protein FA15DRAFT_144700 [Coprinopsis marcescibilis]